MKELTIVLSLAWSSFSLLVCFIMLTAGNSFTRDKLIVRNKLIIINNASYRCTMVKDLKEKQDE